MLSPLSWCVFSRRGDHSIAWTEMREGESEAERARERTNAIKTQSFWFSSFLFSIIFFLSLSTSKWFWWQCRRRRCHALPRRPPNAIDDYGRGGGGERVCICRSVGSVQAIFDFCFCFLCFATKTTHSRASTRTWSAFSSLLKRIVHARPKPQNTYRRYAFRISYFFLFFFSRFTDIIYRLVLITKATNGDE